MSGKTQLSDATIHLDEIALLYSPFENYLSGLVPLMLEHIWQRRNKRGSCYAEELMSAGWLGRLITLDNRVLDAVRQDEIPGWPALRGQIIKNFEDCRSQAQLEEMLGRNTELILEVLSKRFDPDYRFPKRDFDCWWYTIHDQNTHVAVHIVNACQPQSPFEQYEHFVATLSAAVKDAVKKFPLIRAVSCGSWLNNLPKFQKLWPEAFIRSQKILSSSSGFGPGAWGQYMTQNGGFHRGKAAILKKTMQHPFPLTEASCSREEMLDHLDRLTSCFNKDNS